MNELLNTLEAHNLLKTPICNLFNSCARQGYPGVYARVSAAYDWLQGQICAISDYPPATCGNGDSAGSSSGINSASNSTSDGSSNASSNLDLVQPKGISLRVEINYDEYPTENGMKSLTL